MAVDPFALTDLATAKSHLNIPAGTTSQDLILERLINSSSLMIEKYLDRQILQRSYTEYQDGRSNDRLVLHHYPAEKPSELWDDPSSEFTDNSNLIDTQDYDLEDDVGVILFGGLNFSRGNRNIKIVYNAGFATVPYDIAEAALLMVEYQYDLRADRRIGNRSKSKNGESTTFVDGIPKFIAEILEPYRRFDFGNIPAPVGNR